MKSQFHFLKSTTGILLWLLTLVISASCSDNNDDDRVRFLWNQTGCADPWNTGPTNSDEDTADAIISNLTENDIQNVSIINFEYDESLATGCLACNCTTGVVIHVETTEINNSKMENLGFIRDL